MNLPKQCFEMLLADFLLDSLPDCRPGIVRATVALVMIGLAAQIF